MQTTNKDVMQESARVVDEKSDIPDGPNVGPSPQEHLAAKGIVKPPAEPAELPGGADKGSEAGAAATRS
ncbi:hypothetical protein [Comamonas endophytica]|uniref:MARCKS family protein n=1 Tax=Comamonas endophytica TaxID=2949090 RepID=A0ABY6GDC1_9BURK|nr:MULTISPECIES: hypothetical protein [unclassified Acidovorax]MCD2512534.1 hypothetical protein [Acidovorax sp. D4N7]UYG53101.1 hypothetical protein M9799_07770 [Acidovorax sp. 5MLIR]